METEGRLSKRGRLLVLSVALAIMISLATTTLVVVWRWQQAGRDCDRVVATRNDARAMFVWVGEAFPGDDFARRLVDELDNRLPALACNDKNQPVPKELQ